MQPIHPFRIDLVQEIAEVHEQLATRSRTARTLFRNESLRCTLIGLAAQGELAAHAAEGPISVQVVEGTIQFDVEGESRQLGVGTLFALGGGIVHSVRSTTGGVFLLTVAATSG